MAYDKDRFRKILKNVAQVGKELYQDKDYNEWLKRIGIDRTEDMLVNNIQGLKWFVCSCFNRGRSDELSESYARCALQTIDRHSTQISKVTNDETITAIVADYEAEVHRIHYKVNKKDKNLLRSIFKDLLPNIENTNVTLWAVNSMKEDVRLEAIYKTLKITEVGDKLRGCFLRDLILQFHLKDKLKERRDYYFLQPIDTWVNTVARRIWKDDLTLKDIFGKKEWDETDKERIRERIVDDCLDAEVCPLTFNQGLWYIGKKSLDCLLHYHILRT
jgi:hypothetical protein